MATSKRPTHEHICKKPWKYVGYRGFCDFVSSDDDFFILRRFSVLTARVLLALQDELSDLEAQLSNLEDQLSRTDAADVHNGSFRQETVEKRVQLIRSIDKKLRSYNKLVLQHSDLRARPKVAKKDVTSLSNWFSNHDDNAILKEETEYINYSKDLFAMCPRSKSPLRSFLERSQHFRLMRLWQKKPISGQEWDENIHYSSDQRIETALALILTIFGLVMLVAPLWILAFVRQTIPRLAIITTFVVIFLCLVSGTTVAKTFESLAAAAAYSAVLVVFLQIS